MKKWILMALCLLLTGCAKTTVVGVTTVQKGEEGTPATSLQSITTAQLSGQPQSPDGKYTVRLEGENQGITAAGLYPSQCIQIVETESGNVVWETDGAYTVTAAWSPDGKYAAIARAGRTWEEILVVETENFETISVTLPDGSALGEYTFVEDMTWTSRSQWDHRLFFSTRGGEEERAYLFIPHTRDGELTGYTYYAERETLSEEYDFSQDGTAETVSLLTVIDPDGTTVSWYELWVEQAGQLYYLSEDFSDAHAGYNSLLACRKDGKDYLLRYLPGFGMGYGSYSYQLLTLSAAGETVAEECSVEFDTNFHRPDYAGPFDAAAIADFLRQAYALMDQSTLLFSTEGGAVRRDMSGADFAKEVDTFFGLPENPDTWENYLRAFAGEITTVLSPDGRYQARAVENLGGCSIYVTDLSTDETTAVTLPDGSSFGECVSLEEMEWREEGNLFPTVLAFSLRGMDKETDHYRYSPGVGCTFEETIAALEGSFDFDHDGVEEQAQLHTIRTGDPCYYELRIMEQGRCLWLEEAHPAHMGWNTVLACKVDGEDYLLRYNPHMSTGLAGYSYTLFSLSEAGETVVKATNGVSFDVNIGSPVHEPMDAPAIAVFLQEAYGYMENSTLLLSTEDGEFWPTMPGREFFWKNNIFMELPEDPAAWEQAIRDYEADMTAQRTGE